jgi:branched-chain amino acid transport system permease protein
MNGARALLRSETSIALVIVWGVAIAAAMLLNAYWISIAVATLLWIYLCASWNVIGGFVGQVSFGNAAFYGIGAYTSTYLSIEYGVSPWAGMLAGGILAAAVGLAIGYVPFQRGLSPLVFALLTLALGFALEFIVSGIPALGENNGLFVPATTPDVSAFRFAQPSAFLFIIAGLVTVLLLLIQWLYVSRTGFFWRAIHDNENASAAAGIDLFRTKQAALALTAFTTALGGTFQAQYVGYIDPSSAFGIEITIQILLFTVIGGAGSLSGPVIGAILLVPLSEGLRVYLGGSIAGLHHLVFGCALILVILLWPSGIAGALRRSIGTAPHSVASGFSDPNADFGPVSNDMPAYCRDNASFLKVDQLGIQFGGVKALQEVSLTVREGEILGVIGPNGAGKTTLFALLAGFLRPTQGRIEFQGRDVVGLKPNQVRRLGIARTFQITQAFPTLTVFDVVVTAALVQYGRQQAVLRSRLILQDLGLWERREKPVPELTLAEQRRLEIARALATDLKLILLDEVMAGLTPKEVSLTLDLISNIRAKGVTVVLVEHNIRAVMRICDRIAVLDAGKLISLGPPEEVSRDPQVIEAYLGVRGPGAGRRRRPVAAVKLS